MEHAAPFWAVEFSLSCWELSSPLSGAVTVASCSPGWSSQHCSPHHRVSPMSMPLPSKWLSSLSCWELSSPLPRALTAYGKCARQVSVHFSKTHVVVRSHIKCFAFFLKILYGKGHALRLRALFFELVRPRFSPWAPLYLCIEHKAPHCRGSFMSTLLPAERCDSATSGRLLSLSVELALLPSP